MKWTRPRRDEVVGMKAWRTVMSPLFCLSPSFDRIRRRRSLDSGLLYSCECEENDLESTSTVMADRPSAYGCASRLPRKLRGPI